MVLSYFFNKCFKRAHRTAGVVNTFPKHCGFRAGFTIIELLAICGILVMVTGVVLVNNNRFGGVVQLENLTYEMALTIRQAQVYGISVARFGNADYSNGYGIHFDSTSKSYMLFSDATVENGMYDPGESIPPSPYTIQGGYGITQIEVRNTGNPDPDIVPTLDILFKRPEPDAWISASGNSCILAPENCVEEAAITVQSPRGDMMRIVVNINGQISVRKQSQ